MKHVVGFLVSMVVYWNTYDRFAAWLETEARDTALILEQARTLNLPEVFHARERAWIAACKIVAGKLRSIESVTVEP
mgnify:CR=1 FL=1